MYNNNYLSSRKEKQNNLITLKSYNYGSFRIFLYGARAIYGMITDDYDMVDSALEKGQHSLYMSFFDPIGVLDAADVVTSAIEDKTD